MRINISFNLSDAKILTVAKEKGYQEMMTQIVDAPTKNQFGSQIS